MVSDTSVKGISVANTIAHVADENKAVEFKSMGLVLNRVRDASEVEDIRTRSNLDIHGWIREDDDIHDFDFKGKALTGIPDTSPTLSVIENILTRMNVLK